jgi:hypothetical protein
MYVLVNWDVNWDDDKTSKETSTREERSRKVPGGREEKNKKETLVRTRVDTLRAVFQFKYRVKSLGSCYACDVQKNINFLKKGPKGTQIRSPFGLLGQSFMLFISTMNH